MGVEIAMAAVGMAQNSAAAVAQWQDSLKESRAIDEQTRLIQEEGRANAQLSATENAKFLAKQKMAYVVNGVDMTGSPLLVMEETEKIGEDEVDAMKKRTAAAASFSLQKSKRVLSQGRAAFFEASAKNAEIAGSAALSQTGNKSKLKEEFREPTPASAPSGIPESKLKDTSQGISTPARRTDVRRA